MDEPSRRRFLVTGSSGILAGLSGCSGLGDVNTDSATGGAGEETAESERVAELERKLRQKDERIAELQQRVQQLQSGGFDDSLLEKAQRLGKRVRESVVVSIAESERGRATGTAWFIDDHRLMTTGHGAGDVESVTCWTVDGKSFTADVVDSVHGDFQEYSHLDLSVLETEFSGTLLSTGSSESLSTDQPLLQVGHPRGVGNWVASVGRFVDRHRFHGLRSTIPTVGGNSGSPALSMDGNVIGLTTGGSPRNQPHRREGEPPQPASPNVRTSFADAMYANHTPVEAVTAFADQA